VAKGLTSFLENININFINQILGGVLSMLWIACAITWTRVRVTLFLIWRS